VVAEQTAEMRRNDRAYGLYDLLRATKKAPLVVKRAVPRLIHLTGDRFVDTAMLSNLGRIPEPPTFAAKPDSGSPELWFSPPCDPSCSVSIGVATSGQRRSDSPWSPAIASNNSTPTRRKNSPIS
jgi:hypothetical protein